MYTDTHAHLQDEKLLQNIETILNTAKENNVTKIICSSYDLSSSEFAVLLAQTHDRVYATVGVHPHDAKNYTPETEQKLKQLCLKNKVVAYGEIGLDYHYNLSPKDIQKQVFLQQLKLASSLNLPVIIHTREAMGDTLEILRNNKSLLNNGGVFHCFNGSAEVLAKINSMGFYVSYGGAVTFKNANNIVEIVKQTPLDKLLLETDCPYMTPVPHRGEINEPKNIDLIAKKICDIKQITLQELSDITENNVKKIFKI